MLCLVVVSDGAACVDKHPYYVHVLQSASGILLSHVGLPNLPNWYSFLSLLASKRYRRRVVVLQVLGSFMAVIAAVMASSKVPPLSRTLLPVRFSWWV